MLQEAKLALRIATAAFDRELASLIEAGARDLEIAGIDLNGTVKFTYTNPTPGTWTVTDESTLADPLTMRAILTYVRLHFGAPEDYERLNRAYDNQKAQLITATGYGMDGDPA